MAVIDDDKKMATIGDSGETITTTPKPTKNRWHFRENENKVTTILNNYDCDDLLEIKNKLGEKDSFLINEEKDSLLNGTREGLKKIQELIDGVSSNVTIYKSNCIERAKNLDKRAYNKYLSRFLYK